MLTPVRTTVAPASSGRRRQPRRSGLPAQLRLEWRRASSVTATRTIVIGSVAWSTVAAAVYAWVATAMVSDGISLSTQECFSFAVTKASVAPLATGALAVTWLATDRRHGTLAAIALRCSGRTQLVVARWLFTAAVGLATTWTTLAVGLAVAGAVGPSGCTGVGAGAVAVALGSVSIATLGWATLGTAIGLLVRSPSVGLGILVGAPYVVTRALDVLSSSISAPALDRFAGLEPFRGAARLQAPLPVEDPVILGAVTLVPWTWAAASFLGCSAAALTLATRRFRHSDIAAE